MHDDVLSKCIEEGRCIFNGNLELFRRETKNSAYSMYGLLLF